MATEDQVRKFEDLLERRLSNEHSVPDDIFNLAKARTAVADDPRYSDIVLRVQAIVDFQKRLAASGF